MVAKLGKDHEVENVPSNFYKIVFLTPEQGFIIGQQAFTEISGSQLKRHEAEAG